MKVKVDKNYELDKLFRKISKEYAEGYLHFREDGLRVLELDDAKISLIDIFLDKEEFVDYEGDGRFIGVNFGEFARSISLMRGSIVEIGISGQDNERLVVTDGKRKISLKTYDFGEPKQEINLTRDWPVGYRLNTKEVFKDLSNYAKDVDMVVVVGEQDRLIMAGECLNWSFENEYDRGSTEIVDVEVLKDDVEWPIKSSYSLPKLLFGLSFTNLGTCTLSYINDGPLHVVYNDSTWFSIEYLLAPLLKEW